MPNGTGIVKVSSSKIKLFKRAAVDQKAFIERIRNERYRVGDNSANEMKGVLNRTLEKVASELYAKDTHFVLELLQNADDNKYEVGSLPEVVFEADSNLLIIRNNEIGFTEKNVDSLCDVGKSTKKNEKQEGYIGEKGIGFKSVFKVSHAPQIYSNGFHFYFKTADEQDAIGIVLPHWIEEPSDSYITSGTTIVLPAKKDFEFKASHFEDIRPELLLFLRRLNSVKMFNRWDDQLREIHKDFDGSSVCIRTRTHLLSKISESSDRYQIARYEADATSVEVDERKGFKATEIILAFPVTEKEECLSSEVRNVFAFLPIREYGLKFVIQADFLLTSSREEIQQDNPWNRMLLQAIPKAFVGKALPIFKSKKALSTGFYGYLSSQKVDAQFAPVIESILGLLSKAECVLTESGNWNFPGNILIGDAGCKEIVSNDELNRLIEKEYAAREIHRYQETLIKLGCTEFAVTDLAACLKNEFWVEKHQSDPAWFMKVFSYLSRKANNEQLIELLKPLKIIPLSNGAIASTKADAIFFPLKGKPYGFESDMSVLRDGVLPEIGDFSRSRIEEFLHKLGLGKAEPLYVIDKYILPCYSSMPKMSSETHVGHIRYIKDHLAHYLKAKAANQAEQHSILKSIGRKLYFLTQDSEGFQESQSVYLGKDYGNSNDLEDIFSDEESIFFVSEIYIEDQSSSEEKIAWSSFFKALGVGVVPKVVSQNADPKKLGCHRRSTVIVKGTDYSLSKELSNLFSHPDKNKKNQLLRLLAKNWEGYYGSFIKANLKGYYYTQWEETFPSSFLLAIKSLQVPIKNGGWSALEESFLDNDDTRAYFGNDLSFLEVDLARHTGFLDSARVTYKVSLEAALERLKMLAGSKQEVHKESLAKLYNVIALRAAENIYSVQSFFSSKAAIFLEKHKPHWFTSDQVCWRESPNKIIASHYPGLRNEYREHETFFLKIVGIQEKPSADQLLDVLRSIEDSSENNELKTGAAQSIYLELERSLRDAKEAEEEQPDWVEILQSEYLLWTHKHEMHINEGDVFINDLPSIAPLFINSPNFSFLAVDFNVIPRLELFIETNNLAYLSKKIRRILPNNLVETSLPEITNVFISRFPYILRHVYTHHNRAFERLLAAGKLERLSRAQIFSVEELIVQLELEDEEASAGFNCVVFDERIIVDAKVCGSEERLFYELSSETARALDIPESAASINQILVTKSQEIINLILKDLKDLPSDIEAQLVSNQIREEADEPPPHTPIEPGREQKSAVLDTQNSAIDLPLVKKEHSFVTPTQKEAHTETVLVDMPTHNKRQEKWPAESNESRKVGTFLHPVAEIEEAIEKEVAKKVKGSWPDNLNQNLERPTENNLSMKSSFEDNSSRSSERGLGQHEIGLQSMQPKDPGTATTERKGKPQGLSHAGSGLAEPQSNDLEPSERDMQISRAAVSIVLADERRHGFNPIEMDHFNAGYDVYSKNEEEERFIEVKGTDGPWSDHGVSLSPFQVLFAKINQEKSWLYVVEHARSAAPVLYKIKNPFEKITHFRFDSGWKSFAINSDMNAIVRANSKAVLKEGLRITLTQFNLAGKIEKLTKLQDMRCKLRIKLDNGKTTEVFYDSQVMIVE